MKPIKLLILAMLISLAPAPMKAMQYNALLDAAAAGSMGKLANLLARSIRGNALLDAAAAGNLEEVVRLLDGGVSVNYTNEYNITALMRASDSGHLHIAQLLLDRGALVNCADNADATALMGAAQRGHLPIVQLLLDHGASATMATKHPNTALTLAESHGHVPCCELLIERLMKIPNDAQRNKIYLLLLHMRECFGRDISFIMKPHLLRMIEEENKENPQNSIALQEIQKCNNIGFGWPSKTKQDLLDKYGPKNQSCSIQ